MKNPVKKEKSKTKVISKKKRREASRYNTITRRIESLTAEAARLARNLGIKETLAA